MKSLLNKYLKALNLRLRTQRIRSDIQRSATKFFTSSIPVWGTVDALARAYEDGQKDTSEVFDRCREDWRDKFVEYATLRYNLTEDEKQSVGHDFDAAAGMLWKAEMYGHRYHNQRVRAEQMAAHLL
jgi:hypothetical protein